MQPTRHDAREGRDTPRARGARDGRHRLRHGTELWRLRSHLGRALRNRDAVIVTKGGYGVPGCADWTSECITRGIERADETARPVDVFLLHSCERRDDLVEPLVLAKTRATSGAIGCSGDNEALAWAAQVGAFDARAHGEPRRQRALQHIGTPERTLAKPIRQLARAALHRDRMLAMFDEPPPVATAIRFAAFSGVGCVLVGTRDEAISPRQSPWSSKDLSPTPPIYASASPAMTAVGRAAYSVDFSPALLGISRSSRSS